MKTQPTRGILIKTGLSVGVGAFLFSLQLFCHAIDSSGIRNLKSLTRIKKKEDEKEGVSERCRGGEREGERVGK